jgi:crotonobetainyl-CoA:carnitine CoA-transferase CaiB-like acyl-CoA transferase
MRRSCGSGVEPSRDRRTRPGRYDYLVQSEVGYLSATGEPDKPPLKWACLSNPPKLENSEYRTSAGRLKHHAELTQVLDRMFTDRATAHWLDMLAGIVPSSPGWMSVTHSTAGLRRIGIASAK